MASLLKLLKNKDEIVEEVYHRINDAEQTRQHEFDSALRIQAWFRGQRVRAFLKYLNHNALVIQSRWRGYVAMKLYREKLKQHLHDMKLRHYNAMATKVQKVWRGFYSRKHIFDYYSRKRYLKEIIEKNETIRMELQDVAEQHELQREIQRDREQKAKLDKFAVKNHHLVSTEVMPGVYNSPFKAYPNEMEFHLKKAGPIIAKTKNSNVIVEEKTFIFDPSWRQYVAQPMSPLPPIQQKPQGPFRDPHVVQKQRYRPFNPSLRVETDYYSLEKARQEMKGEEWVKRLHDDVWMPPNPVSKSYQRLLHGFSKFGSLPYGTKFFREERPENFTSEQNFRALVPPIPLFDKLNKTYSVGEV